ncbi:MAG: histidinol-phosphatase HisJ family protein [Candidatus Riflebacteria bacterium]|nr:histidinol-phosphatase HisJ family protein [Candidatus Riflebacteria bacterium]
MKTDFVIPWETHGIHVGTDNDHVKHGVDDIERITEIAISRNYPAVSFVIHTPRLTRYRYIAESDTEIKFIRGYAAYNSYAGKIQQLKEKYSNQINIRFGIELEWLGSGLGMQWNRSSILQVPDADFIIGSVHFSREAIPYDGSREEAEKLLKLRGSIEEYWISYINEVAEMIDSSRNMIQVVGHIDLPKLYFMPPEDFFNFDSTQHPVARRMKLLLEMISDFNLALDLNLAGIQKKCGIYPSMQILKHARKLNIPIAIGTDCHHIDNLGSNYGEGIVFALDAGYTQYVSFSKLIPEKRPLCNDKSDIKAYSVLNLGIEMLNRRFIKEDRKGIPQFSFGGMFRKFIPDHIGSAEMDESDSMRIRRNGKSLTLSLLPPETSSSYAWGIYSWHLDKPGILSILFNSLASEEINVETAFLNSNGDGTATAFLSVSGEESRIKDAIDFVQGSSKDMFFTIQFGHHLQKPPLKKGNIYLREMDGVELPIVVSRQMILTVHDNTAGVLLILLSALASRGINVIDLQLGERGRKGYSALGIEGDERIVSEAIRHLGPSYYEISHLTLNI